LASSRMEESRMDEEQSSNEQTSPPLELHPSPPRRTKYRNWLTPTGFIGSEQVNEIIDKSGRVRRRTRVPRREVREEKKRFEEIPDDDVAIGQLLDFDGETVQMGDVSESLRDLEALTFDESMTIDNSTLYIPSYTTSPTMSTLSSNASSLRTQQSPSAAQLFTSAFRQLEHPHDRKSPSLSQQEPAAPAVLKPHPNETFPFTSPFEQILQISQIPAPSVEKTRKPCAGQSTIFPPAAFDRPPAHKKGHSSTPADADRAARPTTPKESTNQFKTKALLDLGAVPESHEIAHQHSNTTPSIMDDLAGLQFSAPEEAIVFQPRRPTTIVDRESADRAFQMFSMGLMGGKMGEKKVVGK
jgi:hypothetical protein